MTSPIRAAMARAMTEDELLTGLLEGALLLGWRCHHVRNSKAGITQGTRGLPDLVMAKDGRVVFIELKDERGQLTEDQWEWMLSIEPGGGHYLDPGAHDTLGRVTALVVRPRDYDHVLRLLAGTAAP